MRGTPTRHQHTNQQQPVYPSPTARVLTTRDDTRRSPSTRNSTKNNRFFDDCHDGINDDNLVDREYGNYTCGEWYFEPRDEVKGDVARALFYMMIMYDELNLVDSAPGMGKKGGIGRSYAESYWN